MSNYNNISNLGTRQSVLVSAVASTSIVFLLATNAFGEQRFSSIARLDTPSYATSGYAPQTITNFVVYSPVEVSALSDLIAAERLLAKIDEENVTIADASARDAMAIIRRNKLGGTPDIIFSYDGILAVQWQRGEYGAALTFAGDGVASISFRRPGQFYAENGIDIAISDDLPVRFIEAYVALA